MPILRALRIILLLSLSILPLSAQSVAATPCQGTAPLQSNQIFEIQPLSACAFEADHSVLVFFLNYTKNHNRAELPKVDYALNGRNLDLPPYKIYFLLLHAGDQINFLNRTDRRTDLYYFAGGYWSLWIWVFCLMSSTLGAVIAFTYYFLYGRSAYFHLAFYSLMTALYNILHPTAFTLNYVVFFMMVSSYFNVVLGFERPHWNQRILLGTLALAALWTASFSAFPYDINIKISMVSSITGVLIILLSSYNLWLRRRIIISSFALANTVFIFYLGLAQRHHLFAATFFQSIFISLMTFRLLQTAVANEKKAREAQELIALKNQELALSNESLESRVLEQTTDLRQQTESLAILVQSSQRILENIEEGIVAFSHTFKVEKVSNWAERELQINAGDNLLHFLERIEVGADQKAATIEALQLSMGADAIQWELNRGQYLQEARLDKRILHLAFHPIVYENTVQSVILTVQDKTEQQQAEDQHKKADERFLRLMQKGKAIISGGNVASQFLQEVVSLSQDLTQLPKVHGEKAMIIMRNLHTIKGAARAAQFHDISELAHRLETFYREQDWSQLLDGIEALRHELEEYNLALREVLGAHPQASSSDRLLDAIHALKPGIEAHLKAHAITLKSLRITDGLAALPAGLRECLMHALNNVCDHGFILPHQRGQSLDQVALSIDGFYLEHRAVIEIRDNGQGLNWTKIQELCTLHQFVPEPNRPASDVLFLDGTSTADTVSQSSGRGVGLSFIKQVVSQLPGGKVSLLDNDQGTGSLLRIEWETAAHG